MPLAIETTGDVPRRDVGRSIGRGLACRCPACGEGRLYRAFLKATPACESCGEAYEGRHRADDMPAYVVMFLVGHILVPLALMTEKLAHPPLWVHFLAWLPLSVVLAVALLPPVKGAIIAIQWANRMHDFSPTPTGGDS